MEEIFNVESIAVKDGEKEKAEEIANQEQDQAAEDMNKYVRVIAGPGTGKTRTIQKRVVHLLKTGETPNNIYLLTFTRAARNDLKRKIEEYCKKNDLSEEGANVRILTLHSLALRVLRMSGLLEIEEDAYRILDAWEAKEIFDREIGYRLNKTPGDVKKLRETFEDAWETMKDPNVPEDTTNRALKAFGIWHSRLTGFYSVILPGDVIHRCVKAYEKVPGVLRPGIIEHIIVDEYQDLNKCDQALLKILSAHSNTLWVAGDDDQSIYSLRNADPRGLKDFEKKYSPLNSYVLKYCFRCTPQVLECAENIITKIQSRENKEIKFIYGEAVPELTGVVYSLLFSSPAREYEAIAQTSKSLLDQGYGGRDKEILILLTWKNPALVQLKPLKDALEKYSVEYELPEKSEDEKYEVKVVYYLVRLLEAYKNKREDTFALRALLHLTKGIGVKTISNIVDYCLDKGITFREGLSNIADIKNVQPAKRKRITAILGILDKVFEWELNDTVKNRAPSLEDIISHIRYKELTESPPLNDWNNLLSKIPFDFLLSELLEYLSAYSEAEKVRILQRPGEVTVENDALQNDEKNRVKVLTIHGSKGLDGGIVFIPGLEEQIIPNKKALISTSYMEEQRRLFYVGLTRARLACILTRAKTHYAGGAASILGNGDGISLPCSCFKKEIGVGELPCNHSPSYLMKDINRFADFYYPHL